MNLTSPLFSDRGPHREFYPRRPGYARDPADREQRHLGAERSLGVKLFNRKSRQASLTMEGGC